MWFIFGGVVAVSYFGIKAYQKKLKKKDDE